MSRTSESKKKLLQNLKMEAAAEIGHLDFVRENNDHYKGDVTARQNGLEGGPIGGQMVKKMIAYAEQQMKQNNGLI
ncbi:small acid-soluble spore protein, alpha [Dehalobacter sp. UNSWDHB]|uniref:alpha/beta-type small acid-soluble spore protein n=1 Tax=unclassified Dehalobacter TaxID=2635733 RepID=UPI00028B556F|nr:MULTISPECIES: alpha/beta-type small acid-soluble spore protein [unclassified Dehalobacter]AFV03972.1 small acid-soluble spore protein, alpha/beta type [Dehalobacter sp. DCA]AFV06952.1 small acid-soluble spore protein, alpha/beta type [Dehalobacter sp. CF]EQB19924.1 small acid-soluble spore protein, alpha [Dehalobacter sp. UNSWDHB]